MSDWVKTSDRLPGYGEPLLIKANHTVQHISYCLDGADDVPDWFEPFHFEHSNDLKIPWGKVSEWKYLDNDT